jgi:hypothetical protein
MSNLLEEAIVDAKALKEAALKSAQETILEKYNPEVKKALENLLLEQDEEMTDPDMDALNGDPSAPLQTGGTLDGQVPMAATNGMNLCPCPDDQKVIEVDFADLQKAMSSVDTGSGMTNDMSQPLAAPMTPAEEAPAAPDVNANMAPEVPPEEEQPLQEDVVDEEIELDEELINSLLEDEELFQEAEGELEEAKDGEPETEEEKELAAMAPPKNKITRGDVVAARIASGKKQMKEDGRFADRLSSEKVQIDGDVGIEAIKDTKSDEQIASIAAKIAKELMTGQLRESKVAKNKEKQVLNETRVLAQKTSQLLEEHKKVQNKNKLLTEENARLLKEHQEMKATALEFAKQIEQMNVQNAKLYYKNQALGSVSLNERQKSQIVEAISKADSVDEVKIIFETLQSTVGSVKTNKEPKSLSEAVTRNSGFSIRTREKEEPAATPAFDRWSKLAGIKK